MCINLYPVSFNKDLIYFLFLLDNSFTLAIRIFISRSISRFIYRLFISRRSDCYERYLDRIIHCVSSRLWGSIRVRRIIRNTERSSGRKFQPFPPDGRLSAAASNGIRVGRRGLFVFIWSAPRAVGFWGGLRSIIVGIYRQKWVAAAATVAWCGDACRSVYCTCGRVGVNRRMCPS